MSHKGFDVKKNLSAVVESENRNGYINHGFTALSVWVCHPAISLKAFLLIQTYRVCHAAQTPYFLAQIIGSSEIGSLSTPTLSRTARRTAVAGHRCGTHQGH
jgi:hypothetical protein